MELPFEAPSAASDQAYADYAAELLESGFQLPQDDGDDDPDDGGVEVSQEFFEALQGIDASATNDDSLDAALAQLAVAEQACVGGMEDLLASPLDAGDRARGAGAVGVACGAGVSPGGERRWQGRPGRVRSYLLVGSLEMAADRKMLAGLGVTHVLNCCGTADLREEEGYSVATGLTKSCACREYFERGGDGLAPCEYLRLSAIDEPGYPLLATHGEPAHAFISGARAAGGVCFVHCVAGRNRSVALCVAHLLMSGMSLIRAISIVGSCRPQCLGNEGFLLQLAQLARVCGGLCPVDPAVQVRSMQCGEAALLGTWHHAEFHGRDVATRARDYTAQSSDRVPCTLVASIGEWVAGSVALVEDDTEGQLLDVPRTPWLASLFVHPAMRRRGVASALIGAAESLARKNGVETLWLHTPWGYLARGLYARLGWVVVEELRGAEAHEFDSQQTSGETFIMSKALT
jgi:GNAT superfamily N-acetyltransferase